MLVNISVVLQDSGLNFELEYGIIVLMSSGPAAAETYKPPEFELRHGRLRARICPTGAFLTELTLEEGDRQTPLLYPKSELEIDDKFVPRGGSHVCMPLFGVSEHLDKHGFGRDVDWQLATRMDDWAHLALRIDEGTQAKGAEHFGGMLATLDYQINDDPQTGIPSLRMSLMVTNLGERVFPLLPGFHPYLARDAAVGTSEDTDAEVSITGEGGGIIELERYSAEQLADVVKWRKVGDGPRELRLGTRIVSLRTEGLPTTFLWSDSAEEYVCFEPTVDGKLTEDNQTASLLAPHSDSRFYRAELSWLSV